MCFVGSSADEDLDRAECEVFWELFPNVFEEVCGKGDIVDFAGLGAMEVGVVGEVWAVAGGFAVDVYLAYEVAFDEGVEAVVNCGEGDAAHSFPCP